LRERVAATAAEVATMSASSTPSSCMAPPTVRSAWDDGGVRDRFDGQIAGVGTTSGLRAVVGRWADGPWGAFADVMVETAQGHRVLLAPDQRVADFVAATYTFDETRIEPVRVRVEGDRWRVGTPSLDLAFTLGGRTLLGGLLRAVPAEVASSPAFCTVTDPFARVLMRGVRTRGTAGGARREWYGATDVHRIIEATGSWEGSDLGTLAPVDPPCRFGFSSTPRQPSVTRVVTTVERPDES
jgi:hypothetical protein